MRAVAIDGFGGPEVLSVRTFPIPEPGPNQILIRVDSAGLGIWDLALLRGVIAQRDGMKPVFPWILGSEGAGKVVAMGDMVSTFQKGDLAYGAIWATNPTRGFSAEYTALDAASASPIPSNLTTEQAGALMIDGMTAFLELDEVLQLKPGEKLMVFGAGGGIGHFAVQLASRMGAHVFAIASGDDGVALAQRLGAEGVVEGHRGDIVASARKFAPNGFDAALVTAGGEAADLALTTLRDGGRATTPGVRPPLKIPPTVRLLPYNIPKAYEQESIAKMNRLIEAAPFEVHLGGTFSLDQVVDAYRIVDSHYLGRLALLPTRKP